MSKYVAIGTLTGILLGVTLQLFFPDILLFEVFFNRSLRVQTGTPTYPQYTSGSIFSVGFIAPAVFGLLGAIVGFAFHRIRNK